MFEAFLAPNSLPLRQEDLNGPSFNPVPALVEVITVWVRTSEGGHTIVGERTKSETLSGVYKFELVRYIYMYRSMRAYSSACHTYVMWGS